MKIHLRDRNPKMVEAWKEKFQDTDVEISCGDIFSGPICDAIVSPANSFGFMDGGIDGYYSMRWPRLQGELQKYLYEHYYGELPVGQAVTVTIPYGGEETILPGPWKRKDDEQDFKYLVCAPTMRVPMVITDTVNAYLAFRATLIALKEFPQIESVLCPGLGTTIGKMDPGIAALQMRVAYNQIEKNRPWEVGNDLSFCWHVDKILRKGGNLDAR